jgi:hypothetical protein
MGGEDFDQMVDEAMMESEKGGGFEEETGPSDFGDDL